MYCKVIYGLRLADGTIETVPVGVFRVTEGTSVQNMRTITAYDCMTLLDNEGVYWSTGSMLQPYTHLTNALFGALTWYSAFGGTPITITLGNTQAEIEALPNGSLFFPIPDITTPREYIAAIAEILGCFVEADKEVPNQINLRPFQSEAVRTILPEHRFSYSVNVDWDRPGDLSAQVCYDDAENELSTPYYYTVEGEKGLSLTGFYRMILDNPILQLSGETRVKQAIQNLIGVLEQLNTQEYLPVSFTFPGDPSIDPGDMLGIRYNGITNRLLVGSIVWNYRNQETITAIGGNKLTSIANAATSSARNATNSMQKKINTLQKQVDLLKSQINSSFNIRTSSAISLAVTDGEQIATDFCENLSMQYPKNLAQSFADTCSLQVSDGAICFGFAAALAMGKEIAGWVLDAGNNPGTYDSNIITIGVNGYKLVDTAVSGFVSGTVDFSDSVITGIDHIEANYSGAITIAYAYDDDTYTDAMPIADFLEMGSLLYAGLQENRKLYLRVYLTGDAILKSIAVAFTG